MNKTLFLPIIVLGFSCSTFAGLFSRGGNHSFPSGKDTVRSSEPVVHNTLPQRFKLLNWNIEKGVQGEVWAQSFKKLAELHDLILLQEATSESHIQAELKAQTEMQKNFFVMWVRKKDQVASGLVNMALANGQRNAWHRTEDVEPFVKTPKLTALTIYNIENSKQQLAVINIHAINVKGVDALERHFRNSMKLAENHKGPLIFVGDFNTWSKERLNIVLKLAKEYGLTYTNFKRPKASGMHEDLDHFFSRGVIVQNIEMLNIKTSDHFPISAEILIP